MTTLLVTTTLLLALVKMALAKVEEDTDSQDFIKDTTKPDKLYGETGDKVINGHEGGDTLYGGDDRRHERWTRCRRAVW